DLFVKHPRTVYPFGFPKGQTPVRRSSQTWKKKVNRVGLFSQRLPRGRCKKSHPSATALPTSPNKRGWHGSGRSGPARDRSRTVPASERFGTPATRTCCFVDCRFAPVSIATASRPPHLILQPSAPRLGFLGFVGFVGSVGLAPSQRSGW